MQAAIDPGLMEIYFVDKNDFCYQKGRILTKDLYRQVWNTENLIDKNDYAVVVFHNGSVVGNMNLQLKKEQALLQSEAFFCQRHWQDYFEVTDSDIAEVSGLAISPNLPNELKQPTIITLSLGILVLCGFLGINILTTIQHKGLYHTLHKGLQLPFFPNTKIINPKGVIPDDNYWKRKNLPTIYYLETQTNQTIKTSFSFLCYLSGRGMQTSFVPRIEIANFDNYPYFALFQKQLPNEDSTPIMAL